MSNIVWGEWYKCFAWIPTKVHDEWIWLETYYTRNGGWLNADNIDFYQTGTIFDVLGSVDNKEFFLYN